MECLGQISDTGDKLQVSKRARILAYISFWPS